MVGSTPCIGTITSHPQETLEYEGGFPEYEWTRRMAGTPESPRTRLPPITPPKPKTEKEEMTDAAVMVQKHIRGANFRNHKKDQEVARAHKQLQRKLQTRFGTWRRAFRLVDQDNSGECSRDELKHMYASHSLCLLCMLSACPTFAPALTRIPAGCGRCGGALLVCAVPRVRCVSPTPARRNGIVTGDQLMNHRSRPSAPP